MSILSCRCGRSIFVALNEFREAIPTIFHNNANLELRPFEEASAREAIVKPSEIEGSRFRWEAGLPERIIRDLMDPKVNPRGNGVLPITLQVVCHTLWSRLPDGEGEITGTSYDAAGGAVRLNREPVARQLERRPFRPAAAAVSYAAGDGDEGRTQTHPAAEAAARGGGAGAEQERGCPASSVSSATCC